MSAPAPKKIRLDPFQSRCIEAVLFSGRVSMNLSALATASSGSATPRARPTAVISSMTSSSKRRLCASWRLTPIGARVTALCLHGDYAVGCAQLADTYAAGFAAFLAQLEPEEE